MLRRCALFMALCALPVAPALAALTDEIQVYTDDLEAPGEFGIELHVNTTPSGRSTPDYAGEVTSYHGLRVTPEISYGLGRGWDAGLYLPLVRDAGGSWGFAGPKLRLKWLPVRPAEGGSGAFLGLNGELAFVREQYEQAKRSAEMRPILGYRGERWLVALNPILEFDLAGEQKGVATFSPALKVARTFGRNALGIEYYAELGPLSDPAPREEQARTLYLVFDSERLNLGVGRGYGSADRWTVKAIFSF